MRRIFTPFLVILWLLLTASSCQTSSSNGGGTVYASNGAAVAGVAVFLILGFASCMGDWEGCFPDEEALAAAHAKNEAARAAFTAGLHAYRLGDPAAIIWICGSAKQGFANAQYFYATHLLRMETDHKAEAFYWLTLAAEQSHSQADLMLQRYFISEKPTTYAQNETPACPTNDQIARLGVG